MIKKLSLYTLGLAGCLVLFNSCKKEYQSVGELDAQNINAYIAKNNITGRQDTLGYAYTINNANATGTVAGNQDSIYYTYEFKRASNATIFKSAAYVFPENFLGYTGTVTVPATTPFNISIPAIRYTLGKLKKGGSGLIVLPSSAAFGKNGYAGLGIESNEIIVIQLNRLTYNNQVEIDNYMLNKFVTANTLNVVTDPNRVRYIISAEGTDKSTLLSTSNVTVKYTGRLLDGTVFDSNSDGISGFLDRFISGWYKTLPGKIGVGGKIRLLIPSDLAYGQTGSKNSSTGAYVIPPNACLDFDIEITAITNP